MLINLFNPQSTYTLLLFHCSQCNCVSVKTVFAAAPLQRLFSQTQLHWLSGQLRQKRAFPAALQWHYCKWRFKLEWEWLTKMLWPSFFLLTEKDTAELSPEMMFFPCLPFLSFFSFFPCTFPPQFYLYSPILPITNFPQGVLQPVQHMKPSSLRS